MDKDMDKDMDMDKIYILGLLKEGGHPKYIL
jgi:hypothetical protein